MDEHTDMTDREVLFGAINKALKNGWKSEIISKKYEKDEPITSIDFAVRDIKKHMDLLVGNFINNPYWLFDHEFAQAFWGIETAKIVWYNENAGNKPWSFEEGFTWQIHLTKMVLEENPIQYLAKFL